VIVELTAYHVVVAILGTLVPIALSALVARFGRRRDLVAPFVTLNAAIAGWNLDIVLLGSLADGGTAAFIDRVAQGFILVIPWCWTVFTAAFVGKPLSPMAKRLAGAWTATLFLLAFTPWYFTGHQRHDFGFYGVAGPAYPLVLLTFLAAYLLAARLLIDGVRNANDPRLRNQRLYVLTASLMMGLLGFDNFLPIFGADHRPFGHLAVLVYSVILSLAVVKHRLMDFTVVFKRGLIYSALTALASFSYLTITLLGSELFRKGETSPPILPVLAGLGVAAGAYPILRWTEMRFLKSIGGRLLDRRRILREAREAWQREGDGAGLEASFRETMAMVFPGVEIAVDWEGAGRAVGEGLAKGREILPGSDGAGDALSVPIRSGNRTAGMVVLRGGGSWSPEELDLAVDLAGQFSSIYRDLSHRNHVQGIERFHRRVLDCIDIGLLLVDGGGGVVAANAAAGPLLEEIGQGPRTIEAGLLERGEPMAGVTGREIRIRVTAITSGRLPDLRVVALEDISAQRELERRAKRAETVSALGRMGAMVAHEIRTPLSTIMGSCTLLRERQPNDPEASEYIGIILDEVRRVERFVDNCLRATRDPKPTLDPRVFDPLVSDVVAACSHGGSGPVRLDLGAGDAMVRVDEDLVRVVVGNLIDNARKSYGTEEGGVEVRTGMICNGGEGRVGLVVADRGRGIAPGEVRQIFEPFWTRRPGGLGLGLTVVANAVSAMSGEISVESSQGKGTVFTVSFPEEREGVA
jgi:signal transduction histidine kinase